MRRFVRIAAGRALILFGAFFLSTLQAEGAFWCEWENLPNNFGPSRPVNSAGELVTSVEGLQRMQRGRTFSQATTGLPRIFLERVQALTQSSPRVLLVDSGTGFGNVPGDFVASFPNGYGLGIDTQPGPDPWTGLADSQRARLRLVEGSSHKMLAPGGALSNARGQAHVSLDIVGALSYVPQEHFAATLQAEIEVLRTGGLFGWVLVHANTRASVTRFVYYDTGPPPVRRFYYDSDELGEHLDALTRINKLGVRFLGIRQQTADSPGGGISEIQYGFLFERTGDPVTLQDFVHVIEDVDGGIPRRRTICLGTFAECHPSLLRDSQ